MIEGNSVRGRSGGATVVVALLVVTTIGAIAVGSAGATATIDDRSVDETNETHVVAPGEEGEYDRIQPALDNATDGDDVVVHPGTYAEALVIEDDVTLVAPEGASLNGSTVDDTEDAILVRDGATPTIDGFSVTQYVTNAIYLWQPGDGWTVRNVTVENTTGGGLLVTDSEEGTVNNVSVVNSSGSGITVFETGGEWHIQDVRIENVSDYGVVVRDNTSTVRVENATITGADLAAMHGDETDNDWLVENLTTRRNEEGIDTYRTSGNWTIQNSSFESAGAYPAVSPGFSSANWTIEDTEIVDRSPDPRRGIFAYEDDGRWTIRNTTVAGVTSGVEFTKGGADWSIEGSRIENTTGPAISVDRDDGDWEISETTVANTTGIVAEGAGNWTVDRSTIADSRADGIDLEDASGEGSLDETTIGNSSGHAIVADGAGGGLRIERTDLIDNGGHGLSGDGYADAVTVRRTTVTDNGDAGISARDGDGNWSINSSTITGNEPTDVPTGIDADGAAFTVNATDNWWGQPTGASPDQCAGNVDCGDALSEPPAPTVSDYADEDGIVRLSGLRAAVEDWRAGRIRTTLLLAVVEAWSDGTPVE